MYTIDTIAYISFHTLRLSSYNTLSSPFNFNNPIYSKTNGMM